MRDNIQTIRSLFEAKAFPKTPSDEAKRRNLQAQQAARLAQKTMDPAFNDMTGHPARLLLHNISQMRREGRIVGPGQLTRAELRMAIEAARENDGKTLMPLLSMVRNLDQLEQIYTAARHAGHRRLAAAIDERHSKLKDVKPGEQPEELANATWSDQDMARAIRVIKTIGTDPITDDAVNVWVDGPPSSMWPEEYVDELVRSIGLFTQGDEKKRSLADPILNKVLARIRRQGHTTFDMKQLGKIARAIDAAIKADPTAVSEGRPLREISKLIDQARTHLSDAMAAAQHVRDINEIVEKIYYETPLAAEQIKRLKDHIEKIVAERGHKLVSFEKQAVQQMLTALKRADEKGIQLRRKYYGLHGAQTPEEDVDEILSTNKHAYDNIRALLHGGRYRAEDVKRGKGESSIFTDVPGGTNPNEPNGEPLIMACRIGHADTVEALLSAGANPNYDRGDRTGEAISTAARNGYADIVRILLNAPKNAANPNVLLRNAESIRDEKEPVGTRLLPPLLEAIAHGHVGVVRVLLGGEGRYNTKVSIANHLPYMWAASTGNAYIVRLLLEHGVPVDARAWEPFLFAASRGFIDVTNVIKRAAGKSGIPDDVLLRAVELVLKNIKHPPSVKRVGNPHSASGEGYARAKKPGVTVFTKLLRNLMEKRDVLTQAVHEHYGALLDAAEAAGDTELEEMIKSVAKSSSDVRRRYALNEAVRIKPSNVPGRPAQVEKPKLGGQAAQEAPSLSRYLVHSSGPVGRDPFDAALSLPGVSDEKLIAMIHNGKGGDPSQWVHGPLVAAINAVRPRVVRAIVDACVKKRISLNDPPGMLLYKAAGIDQRYREEAVEITNALIDGGAKPDMNALDRAMANMNLPVAKILMMRGELNPLKGNNWKGGLVKAMRTVLDVETNLPPGFERGILRKEIEIIRNYIRDSFGEESLKKLDDAIWSGRFEKKSLAAARHPLMNQIDKPSTARASTIGDIIRNMNIDAKRGANAAKRTKKGK